MMPLPFVSVIMPIRDEVKYIESSLNSVLSQDYPKDRMEVIVVDGMSTDGTRELVESFIKKPWGNEDNKKGDRFLIPVKLLNNPRGIVSTALNIGLNHAQGAIIVRIDGHCEIDSDYIRHCIAMIEQKEADCVGGILITESQGWIGKAISLAMSSPFGVGNARFRYGGGSGWVDTVAFGAYKRTVFDKIGNFDEELIRNQDDEFNFRLIQSGGKIWLDHTIRAVYYSRTTIIGLCRQYFQYGVYKVRVIQKRGALPSWRHIIPLGFVVSIIITILLTLITNQVEWVLAVIGPYALANTSASFWTARKHPNRLPILPVVFFCLHISYGVGSVAGVWKWRHHFFKT